MKLHSFRTNNKRVTFGIVSKTSQRTIKSNVMSLKICVQIILLETNFRDMIKAVDLLFSYKFKTAKSYKLQH